jgi:hypothetical protein
MLSHTKRVSRLRYSPHYAINIDPDDIWCADISPANYGKQINFQLGNNGYFQKRRFRGGTILYLHKVVADACVPNPRPDIFTFVDHRSGDKTDNRPCNLRHVNQHLNTLNRLTRPGKTPPGVSSQLWRTKDGKPYTRWIYTKSACCLWSFRKKSQAVQKALEFNLRFFDALYEAYLNSPQNGDRAMWRAYWSKLLVATSQFNYKVHRESVRNLEKFVVGDDVYKKMCT